MRLYSKTCVKCRSQNVQKLFFKASYPLMKVLTFIKLPIVIKIFVLSVFEWPFYTGFTVFGI